MSSMEEFGFSIMGNTVPYDPNHPCTAYAYVKEGYKKLDWIRICRIPLAFWGDEGSFPGHYWLEIIHKDENTIDEQIKEARKEQKTEAEIIKIGNVKSANGFRESYGWYPTSFPLTITPNEFQNSMTSGDISMYNFEIKEKGALNGDSIKRREKDASEFRSHITKREAGRRTKNNDLSIYAFDPHQCSRFQEGEIKMISNPYLLPNDNRTRDEIIEEIRDFSSSFFTKHSNEWSWYNDGYEEVNCHTFLFLLLGHVGLADPIIAEKKDKHFNNYFKNLESKSMQAKSIRLKLLTRLKNISEELYLYGISC